MKIVRATRMIRQLASKSSRSFQTIGSAGTPFRGKIGVFQAVSKASVASFCTGDIPPMMGVSNNDNIPSKRAFSSKATLIDILSREENEEIETGNIQMPQDLLDLRETIQESWKIVENGASTTLYKIDSGINKIQVNFHCQDTLEVVEEEEYDDDNEDEDEEPAAPVRFSVTVTKAGKSLNFLCFSEYGEVKIEGVSTKTSVTAEFAHENPGSLPKIEYQGPDFNELAEDLQEAFAEYLDEECGVNGDIAAFVAMSADHREEINYVDFLKQAQSILS